MTKQEIEAYINELPLSEIKELIESAYMVQIPEDHVSRRIAQDVYGTCLIATAILGLMPFVAKRLIDHIYSNINNIDLIGCPKCGKNGARFNSICLECGFNFNNLY